MSFFRNSASATASSGMQMLQAQLDVANAQNVRLAEENAVLRHRLSTQTTDQHSNASLNVTAQIRAFQLEDERDRMFENLERTKKQYNKLHDAYLLKVRQCKALEGVFQRQKTLPGLVMKSAVEQRHKEPKLMQEKRLSEHREQSQTEQLQLKVGKLQTALDESYDIIDELEFELESIDLLEVENQRLQNELLALKSQPDGAMGFNAAVDTQKIEQFKQRDVEEAEEEAPPRYEDGDYASAIERPNYRDLVASSSGESHFNDIYGDADSGTLERAAMTHSLMKNAEVESNCLRRELLRSRLQNTIRTKYDIDD